MTKLIIFSKNRPMQLQATLDSVELHTKGFFNSISVLYLAEEGYEEGYKLLKERKPQVEFVEETSFKTDLMAMFRYDYTCFLTDDDIVAKDFNRGLFKMMGHDVVCFSLRLGLNINYCYSHDQQNTIGTHQEVGEFIKWRWLDQELDFSYPLSVTAHIFRTEQIKAISAQHEFNNPNIYEGVLQRSLGEIQPLVVSYKESKVFGVPANKVNITNNNRNALEFGYSTEELNKLYLSGKIIDVEKLPDIISAQQEFKYVFK